MSCLLVVFQISVSLLLTVKRGVQWIYNYAKVKPPKVPWIYGRPYLFRGRYYTYERPRKPRTFVPHSESTLRELRTVEHHRRMRKLMRARKHVRESYRVTGSGKRRRKRNHRAHPRLFVGRSRGRSANYDCSLKLTQLSVPWDMPPEKRSNSQRIQALYVSFRNYWRKRMNPGSVMVDRVKKFPDGSWKSCSSRLCIPNRVPRWGLFNTSHKAPLQEDPKDPLFVLSAPNGLLQPLRCTTQGPQTPTEFQVIWDTGASRSVSPNKEDFEGGIRPSTTRALTGLAEGLDVCGEGEVKWTVMSDDGRPFVWKHIAYYVPGSPCRLLSPQTFTEYAFGLYGHAYEYVMRAYDPRNKSMMIRPSTESKFLGCQLDLPTVTCQLDERTNLPISMASNDPLSKPTTRANLCVTDEKNQNLSHAQKELLRWHFRLGHLNFKSIQLLLRSKTLG
jgi:hypothetical protein